jgi:hypothetical protein
MLHENFYNLPLAQQVETAHRLLNDVELQRMGAVALDNGRLEVTKDQSDTAKAEMASSPEFLQKQSVEGEHAAASSAETDASSREKLRGIVERSGIAVVTYMSNEVIDGKGYGIRYLHSKTMDPGDPIQFENARTVELPLVELNAQGVAEIMTFSALTNSTLLSKVPGHQGQKGNLTAVTYESTDAATVLARDLPHANRAKFHDKIRRYPTGFEKGAPGASFSYNLFMAPDDAEVLKAMVTERPETAHLLNETIMTQAFGASPEGFRAKGPQYDAWRASDGGQAKLAIRDSLNADAAASQIITY